MIWIISMDKERHVQRQAFPSGQALRDFANGAPYSWYEQKVLLVTEDRLVLYSSMGRQKGTKKMQMQDVLAWYLDALGEGRADATYARLTGAREIQEGDFCLAEDAADWSPSPDGAGECWVYQLTPGCNVDEVLGTYVETWENEDTASVYFFVEPGYYQLLKLAGKSMLERIGEVERERVEYRTYIEQWVHEVKTPITALKLLCENNRSPFSREVLAELENINRCAEQALYYARSEHTEKDYSIREMSLADVVHGAIADNKYLLRQCDMAITVDDLEPVVYADDKWVRFILNQIISNAVKYRAPQQPTLHIFTERSGDQVLLSIADNGIGIPESDLPRIFEKGFTGQNGRTIHSSTGIGLYLCKRLCDKLGIGLSASSAGGSGTTITLAFHINDFITGVQS